MFLLNFFFHPKFFFNEWSKARHNATKHSSFTSLPLKKGAEAEQTVFQVWRDLWSVCTPPPNLTLAFVAKSRAFLFFLAKIPRKAGMRVFLGVSFAVSLEHEPCFATAEAHCLWVHVTPTVDFCSSLKPFWHLCTKQCETWSITNLFPGLQDERAIQDFVTQKTDQGLWSWKAAFCLCLFVYVTSRKMEKVCSCIETIWSVSASNSNKTVLSAVTKTTKELCPRASK